MLVARKLDSHQTANEFSFSRKYINEQVAKKRRRASVKLYLIGLVFLATMLAITTVSQFGRLVALSYQVNQVEQRLRLAREEQSRLRVLAAEYSSLERVERIAVEELGYQYPREEQTKVLATRKD